MNKKITASVLAMTMGAGLVGSISGTVAWYQYSTRAQLGMLGASIGVDKNLEINVTAANVDEAPAKNDANWTNEINSATLASRLNRTFDFNPITTDAEYAKNGSFGSINFRGNPIQYKTNPTQWVAATADDYVEFKVWVRAIERDGSDEKIANPDYVAKQLGLYDATIKHVANGTKKDISSAVRVQITAGTNYAVMAKDSDATDLYGPLDLDNVPGNDKAFHYSDIEEAGADLVYGLDGKQGATYNLEDEARGGDLLCDDPISETGTNAGKLVVKGGLNLGATTTSAPASFKVKIWLEGWAKLGTSGSESAMWATKDYVGSKFFVGLTVASGDARE